MSATASRIFSPPYDAEWQAAVLALCTPEQYDVQTTSGQSTSNQHQQSTAFVPTPASRISLQAVAADAGHRLSGRGIDWGCGAGVLAIASALVSANASEESGTTATAGDASRVETVVVGLDCNGDSVAAAREAAARAGLCGPGVAVEGLSSGTSTSSVGGGGASSHVESALCRFFVADSFVPIVASEQAELKRLMRYPGGADFVIANPPASEGEGFEFRRRVLREASPWLREGGAVFLQISFQYSPQRIALLAERDAPEFRYVGCISSTDWVPFDQTRDDLRDQLENYAAEEARGGVPYTFRSASDPEQLISAQRALAEFRETGRSPLSKWQMHAFVKQGPPQGCGEDAAFRGGLIETRTGSSAPVDDGCVRGYAAAGDGGMLLPAEICRLAFLRGSSGRDDFDHRAHHHPWEQWRSWEHLGFADLATEVVWPFLRRYSDAFPSGKDEFRDLLHGVYTVEEGGSFDSSDILPVVDFRNRAAPGFFVAECFHGPTLSFKDYALLPTGAVLNRILERRSSYAECIVATSGDTGSAAIAAMRRSTRAKLAVLLPGGNRVSRLQRRQMTTANSTNAMCFSVNGANSDSLDEVVLQLFKDRARHGLCSINSTNPLRIMFQMCHWFWAYFRARELLQVDTDDWPELDFIVPTGALGNGTAGYAANLAGLPIRKITLATNANDALAKWLADGNTLFRAQEAVATTSPAIDIGVPYNLERILFLAEIESAAASLGSSVASEALRLASEKVRLQAESLRTDGTISASDTTMAIIRRLFASQSISESLVQKTIGRVFDQAHYVLDTHSAVAVAACENVHMTLFPPIVLATAHPIKDADAVSAAIGGKEVEAPTVATRALDPSSVERCIELENDIGENALAHVVAQWFDEDKSSV